MLQMHKVVGAGDHQRGKAEEDDVSPFPPPPEASISATGPARKTGAMGFTRSAMPSSAPASTDSRRRLEALRCEQRTERDRDSARKWTVEEEDVENVLKTIGVPRANAAANTPAVGP